MKSSLKTYRVVLLLVTSFLLCFFAWASLTQIDQQVRGIGKIIPAGKVRTIQHLENAIVREIFVAEGQTIKAGDKLFQLANTKAEADMKEITVALNALDMRKIRLKTELAGKSELEFPKELVGDNYNLESSERKLFESRKLELSQKLDGLKKRMKQKVLKLDELDTTIKNLSREQAVSQEQLEIKKKLRRKGAISHSQYLEAQSTVKNFDTRVAQVKNEIPIVKTEISEIVNLLEETRQKWRSGVIEELGETNLDIKKLGERIVTFSDAVNRTEIQSPVSGVVNKLHVNTIGGVIQSGQVLAEIIPVEELLIVEGQISTEDRGKVWLGLPVAAKITAYDYSIYGSVQGELTYISADSFVDNQGIEYYQVRVTLSKSELAEGQYIFPGMSVDINIMANKVSVLHALLKPFLRIRENALREI